MDATATGSPRCPFCDLPPGFVFGGGTQCFCFNDDCCCVTWDPRDSPAKIRRTAVLIDLSPLADPDAAP